MTTLTMRAAADGPPVRGVRALRDDSAGDFTDFFTCESDGLVRLGYLLTGDRELARDTAQEVMTQVCSRWAAFDTHGHALGYARRSVVNAARDAHRHHRVVQDRAPLMQVAAAHASQSPDIAVEVARSSAVWQCLGRLSPRQREVLVLRYWLDLPEREIAQVLRVRPGTVKTTASRALAALESLLAPGGLA